MMTPTQRTILVLYAIIVAAWPIRHLVVTLIFRRLDFLTLRSPRLAVDAGVPAVTAIIPARNEEAALGACLDSVRAQNYPNLAILVVDDRSTDATAAVAARAAAADPRVRLVSIHELPGGWTGKTHALHVAAGDAPGEWLWFLDADTRHHPEVLSVCLEYARRNRAGLVSLLPEMRCESFWERVVQPLMGIVLMRSFPLFRVNDDRAPLAFANGQFILVRRDAYDAAGGHAAVRDRFVEDIHLARRVKGAGVPIRVAITTDLSATRMYASLPAIVNGWSRILYDALGRSPWPLLGKILEPLIFSQTGAIALVWGLVSLAIGTPGPFGAWMVGLAVVHLLLQVSVLWRMYRIQSPSLARSAWWYPLAGVVSDGILARSIAMCLTGRVTWRGTAYQGTIAGSGRDSAGSP